MGTRSDRRDTRARRALTVLGCCLLATAFAIPQRAARAESPAARAESPAAAKQHSAKQDSAKQESAPPREPLDRWPQSMLGIRSGDRVHRFRVWIADTFLRREQGLMWVKQLPPDRGMLFVFEQPQLASFWMKNTYIPLDLLFVAPDGRVIRIAENATPHSLDTIDSMGYVTGVLELAGGTAKRLSLRSGDTVLHPAFGRR